MNARLITQLAAACALCACSPSSSPAEPTEPSARPPVEALAEPVPEASDIVTGDEPDLRNKVDGAMRSFKVAGVQVYRQVSQDFPDEFAILVDATVAAVKGDQTERDAGLAGKTFAVTLKEKYADRMRDAGPEKIRALLTTRRDLFVSVQEVYGAEACNQMARTDAFAEDTVSRVGPAFTRYMVASWSAMKAGVAAPAPQDHPTRQDILALASAALNAGGPGAAINARATDNALTSGRECDILIALLNAELALTGQAGERLRAGSTVSLPFAQP